jgi:LmbE family N-acetylglucosaminyl deacetylase
VPFARQVYLELADGGLTDDQERLDKLVEEVATDFAPDRIFTTGISGYDGHPDHIAMHNSAVRSARALRQLGYHTTVWALNEYHVGEYAISGDEQRKIGAMTVHASQNASSDPRYWGGVSLYTPLIIGRETYTGVDY